MLFLKRLVKRLFPPTAAEKELIARLRNEVRSMPKLEISSSPADDEWARNRMKLRSAILKHDPRFFLSWDVIKHTMFVGNAPSISYELNFLKNSRLWESRYEKGIREDRSGRPLPYSDYKMSSGNLIHHGYSVCQFEDCTNTLVSELDLVFEFGGGYGSMCRLFHRLGFRGLYIIYDFEEFNALQRYYLGSIGLPILNKDAPVNISNGIACISDISRVSSVLNQVQRKLFIGTWSLSETSMQYRSAFQLAMPEFEYYLLAYQKQFGEVDNSVYFENFMHAREHLSWKTWEIPHLKENYYLMGMKL
jgi:hypothetical protein